MICESNLSGNIIFSDYLNILYIPNIGELVIFSFAFVGACIGFIWYNSYPAQVFMGDTGSLSIGAIIAPFVIGLIADRYFEAQKILGILHIMGALLCVRCCGIFVIFARCARSRVCILFSGK